MQDDLPSIRLLTITRLWTFGRRLHTIGAAPLWAPISHRTLGWGVVVFGTIWLLLRLAHVSVGGSIGLALHFSVPGLLTWWILHIAAGGQRPWEFLRSWAYILWQYALGWSTQRELRPVRVRSRVRVREGSCG